MRWADIITPEGFIEAASRLDDGVYPSSSPTPPVKADTCKRPMRSCLALGYSWEMLRLDSSRRPSVRGYGCNAPRDYLPWGEHPTHYEAPDGTTRHVCPHRQMERSAVALQGAVKSHKRPKRDYTPSMRGASHAWDAVRAALDAAVTQAPPVEALVAQAYLARSDDAARYYWQSADALCKDRHEAIMRLGEWGARWVQRGAVTPDE